jgi:hypothetical protein
MKRLRIVGIPFAFLCLTCPHLVFADSVKIEYAASDLGLGVWQYDYYLSYVGNFHFMTDQGFKISFDYTLYSGLADPYSPDPAANDWGILILDTDSGLPADGYYDALSLGDYPSYRGPFSVTFSWASTSVPGSQEFEVYQLDNAGNVTDLLDTGRTVPLNGNQVPEPGTALLLVGGLAVLGAIRWKKQ